MANESLIADMRKQLFALQSENFALKRSLPQMIDTNGKDLTTKIQGLYNRLALREQESEKWENKYAEAKQELARFKDKLVQELEVREKQITMLKDHARLLEEENSTLKEQAENDHSKIYHLQKIVGCSSPLSNYSDSIEPDPGTEEHASESDLLNKSVDTKRDLDVIESQMNVLRDVCNQLFGKLQNTATFLQTLLEDCSDDNSDEELRINLDNAQKEVIETKEKLESEVQKLKDEVQRKNREINDFRQKFNDAQKLIDNFKAELIAKERAVADAETKHNQFEQDIINLKNALNSARAEIRDYAIKCESLAKTKDDAESQLLTKENYAQKLEKTIQAMQSNMQSELKNSAEQQLALSFAKTENERLKKDVQRLEVNITETAKIIEKGNQVLRQKLDEAKANHDIHSPHVNAQNTPETPADCVAFAKLLRDCTVRSDKLVQLQKKLLQDVEQKDKVLQYTDLMLNESRIIRLVLHKLCKFFESNQRKLDLNKKFAQEIQSEVGHIYENIETVMAQPLKHGEGR
ncbi:hypothetical protein Ddc_02526 [Ditylenchus destructor]|nr:hypothetical protein Ddc_02526 [Ditylenchus destructor]